MAFVGSVVLTYPEENEKIDTLATGASHIQNPINSNIILIVSLVIIFYVYSVLKTYKLLELEQYGLRLVILTSIINTNRVSRLIIASFYIIIETIALLCSVIQYLYFILQFVARFIIINNYRSTMAEPQVQNGNRNNSIPLIILAETSTELDRSINNNNQDAQLHHDRVTTITIE